MGTFPPGWGASLHSHTLRLGLPRKHFSTSPFGRNQEKNMETHVSHVWGHISWGAPPHSHTLGLGLPRKHFPMSTFGRNQGKKMETHVSHVLECISLKGGHLGTPLPRRRGSLMLSLRFFVQQPIKITKDWRQIFEESMTFLINGNIKFLK